MKSTSTRRNFRSDYRSQLYLRFIDACLHTLIGLLLIWGFRRWEYFSLWYVLWAFFPDVYLIFMWPHGMITKRYLAKGSSIVAIHKWMHSFYPMLSLMIGWMITRMEDSYSPERVFRHALHFDVFLMCNLFFHVWIDNYTHDNPDAKRLRYDIRPV